MISPVTSRAGVTSKAGLAAALPLGVTRIVVIAPSIPRPVIVVTSLAARSSIGISRTPSATLQSIVGDGTATQNGTPLSCAASAFRYVPILLATSPVRVVRSVPTITRSTLPCCIRWPPALSEITVWATP